MWHECTDLIGFDAVFVPGGFSYGDYLRCGAMASRAPIMESVRKFAELGRPVIGACNGFQILCELGILPGALLLNEAQKFVCKNVFLAAENKRSIWTENVTETLCIPIAHGEGRYVCEAEELNKLEQEGLVAFRYVNSEGQQTAESNPNGSVNNIAGILNGKGNVLGLMPHPERASNAILGSTDGLMILKGLKMVSLH